MSKSTQPTGAFWQQLCLPVLPLHASPCRTQITDYKLCKWLVPLHADDTALLHEYVQHALSKQGISSGVYKK